MSARPLWFGPVDRPLFGWLHLPDQESDEARARAGVILCPPIGYEGVCAHRTYVVLAERLAAAGFAALRFDYDGTGDSAGANTDPTWVSGWLRSIQTPIELLRETGVPKVAIVGMRLGATLAANAGAHVDAAVLWDPVWSGRSYVRQLRALQLLGLEGVGSPPVEEGTLAVAGTVYPAAAIEELRRLTLPDVAAFGIPTFVLVRSDHDLPASLPPSVESAEAAGQADVVDVWSLRARVPEATVDRVVAWLDDALPRDAVPFAAPPPNRVATPADGVVEHLTSIGAAGMFGVITEPAGGRRAGTPLLLLLNNSVDHHVGPNRMWVEWSRTMATHGFASVRLDLTGIGDSPARPGHPEDHPYGPASVTDIVEAVRDLDTGDGVVAVGLCSGARNALDAAPLVPLRGVCAINPPLHLSRAIIAPTSPLDPTPAAVERANRYHPIRHRLLALVPTVAWRMLDRLRLVPSRARALEDALDSGADVLVVAGADDFYLARVRRDSAWHLARLRARPRFRLATVENVDHGLFAPIGREQVLQIVTDHVVETYGSPGLAGQDLEPLHAP